MQIVSSIAAMQRLARKWQRAGTRIGFVPTMGYLHNGHLSLVKRARQAVGKSGKVVVSIYVNPTQFAPTEDLAKYPRDLKRDLKMCRAERVDVTFVPADGEMYSDLRAAKSPASSFSTYVVEEKLSPLMEGASRPLHFRGVCTVVAKLFNLVTPEVAVFGQKDFQQAAIIKRMVSDLNFPVKIIIAPTLREGDGLAVLTIVNPEEAVFRLHVRGHVPQQFLVLAKDFGGAADRQAAGKGTPTIRSAVDLGNGISDSNFDVQREYSSL